MSVIKIHFDDTQNKVGPDAQYAFSLEPKTTSEKIQALLAFAVLKDQRRQRKQDVDNDKYVPLLLHRSNGRNMECCVVCVFRKTKVHCI